MSAAADGLIVRLVSDEAELSRRIQSADRIGRKLADPVDAVTNVRSYTVLDPRLPHALTLDTTDLSPEAVVAGVLAHINSEQSASFLAAPPHGQLSRQAAIYNIY